MKQVGARDETKLLDGFGRCGRRLCCSSWLTEFHPVSIRMAKNQGLPLAPAEISGLCGRLLCCLAYENEQYTKFRRTLPKVGTQVITPHGQGVIVGLNVLTESALVKLQSELTVEVEANEVQGVSTDGEPAKSSGKRRKKRRRT
jgi:cell fate regulator YaaT (PSP1 superfamily)